MIATKKLPALDDVEISNRVDDALGKIDEADFIVTPGADS